MFALTYRPTSNRNFSKVEYFDDIKTLGDAVLGITNSEKEANSAIKWCGNATFGNKVVRQPNYKIECFNETQLKEEVEKVVKEICDRLNIGYSFVGWDNDALTWDIDADLSWIKFHHQYGYYCVINQLLPDGTCNELFSTTSRDKNKFISDVVVFVDKITRKTMKQTANKNNKDLSNKIPQSNEYCKFVVGQTYMGKCNRTSQNMSIIITKKTPQFIFYRTDTGIEGKAIVKYMGGHEAILIKKVDDLVVCSTDKWS